MISGPATNHPSLPAVRYGWDAHALPRWPLALPFVSYPICWLLGISDLIWIFAGIIMLGILIRTRRVVLPAMSWIWILFLFWVCSSMIMIDSFGRLLGAGYRFMLYLSAGITAVYVFNARSTLTLRYVTGVMTVFLTIVTVGGYLAMVAPLLVVHTPASWVVPASLASNDLVGEMIIRRTTQWNPDAWVPQVARPSAPFVYTNTWGNVYSLILPLSLIYLRLAWKSWLRWLVVLLVISSAVPAAATLNRGMLIGLLVVLSWCGIQAVRRGAIKHVLAGACVVVVVLAVWVLSGSASALLARAETSNSTVDRQSLYSATIEGATNSPLFGFGAPRPAVLPWLPSVGTQGQVWTVMFSHGFVGLALFLGFFLLALPVVFRRTDWTGAVLGGVIVATLVESFYYGMMTGLTISLIAVALLRRQDTRMINIQDRRERTVPTPAILPRRGLV